MTNALVPTVPVCNQCNLVDALKAERDLLEIQKRNLQSDIVWHEKQATKNYDELHAVNNRHVLVERLLQTYGETNPNDTQQPVPARVEVNA